MRMRKLYATFLGVVGSGVLLPAAPFSARAANPEQRAPASTAPAATAQLPDFRPGLWEFRRTLRSGPGAKPQEATLRKCANPGADMREKWADLEKKHCQFTPLIRSDDRYTSSWICPTAAGPIRFRDVLTVRNAHSYEDVSESRSGQKVSEQRIVATRLGECPGLGAAVPAPPITKRPPPHS